MSKKVNKKMMAPSLYFFAYAACGKGISGSDRIFIEFAKRWRKKSNIHIYLTEEGENMCERQSLTSADVFFHTEFLNRYYTFGFITHYIARILKGVWMGLTLQFDRDQFIIYSASDFWMDVIPCVFIKLRYSHAIWVASWYQTAPNPFKGFSEGRRDKTYKVSSTVYWISQFPIKRLITRFADKVLVNNEEEKKQFLRLSQKHQVYVLLGAVDIEKIDQYKKNHESGKKIHEAIFQGRFHPQKGVVELIAIWEKVVKLHPDFRLVMIGDGPLMPDVIAEIKKRKLEDSISVKGYVFDGPEKYTLFAQSKLVLHPALYDSGGMAAAEAMAFGLPCVGFDLKAYNSYYPQGMVKVPYGNLDAFANEIIRLLTNTQNRVALGKVAEEMIYKNYSWENRAADVYDYIHTSNL